MSNAAAMTLEERLVQHIKETGLGVLITDEDAITELTRRAVRDALLQPVRTVGRYGGYDEKDSPVVAAAREIAREAVKQLVEEEVARIKADPESMETIRKAMMLLLPEMMRSQAMGFYDSVSHQSAQKAVEMLQGMGRVPR